MDGALVFARLLRCSWLIHHSLLFLLLPIKRLKLDRLILASDKINGAPHNYEFSQIQNLLLPKWLCSLMIGAQSLGFLTALAKGVHPKQPKIVWG